MAESDRELFNGVNKNIDDQQYLQTLESVFPTKFGPGSLADRLLIRGRQEGRELAVSVIQWLQKILGEDSLQPDQLQSLSLESLKERIEALQQRLDAKSN